MKTAAGVGRGAIGLRSVVAGLASLVVLASLLGLALGSCGATVVKPGAFDQALLEDPWFAARLHPADRGERVVDVGASWMEGVGSGTELTFAGLRDDGAVRYGVVVECDPRRDLLVLWPLAPGESPVDSLTDADRRRELEEGARRLRGADDVAEPDLVRLSLGEAIAERRLVSPIPQPRHIYAVGANYASHLEHDLAVDEARSHRDNVRHAQPRVFIKYPPVPPPGPRREGAWNAPHSGVVGPFEPVVYPPRVTLPGEGDGGPLQTETALDYEVEIGVVLGRSLTWETVRGMSDDELHACIVGMLIVSDTKARNPQVVNKIEGQGNDVMAPEASDHLTKHRVLDKSLGDWDRITCHWWSYASSCGDFASLGPFLAATDASGGLGDRAMISARTYAPERVRARPLPKGRQEEVFYLRQAARTTEDQSYEDALYWTVPQIIRSILDPGSALDFGSAPPVLEKGDVISLGTPGGTVITSRPQYVVDILTFFLCWWDPVDFHDAFFDGTMSLYLHKGDRVFFWAEGLGYQQHPIERAPSGGGPSPGG